MAYGSLFMLLLYLFCRSELLKRWINCEDSFVVGSQATNRSLGGIT